MNDEKIIDFLMLWELLWGLWLGGYFFKVQKNELDWRWLGLVLLNPQP